MQTRQRFTAMTAITVAMCATGPAVAQDAADNLQEIVVTGSRLKGSTANIDTPTPVTTISADELSASGPTSLGDYLAELPALRGTFTNGNSSRFIGTAGVNFLDLRGLGTSRTLVLVNGRRHVAGSNASQEVDINSIPQELIERIDVITGGASAVYGSDAIAGVVNIVTKDNFEGMKVGFQTGMSSRGDNENYTVSFTAGKNFLDGRANLAASLEYSREESYDLADRNFLFNRAGFGATNSDPMGRNNDGIPDSTFFSDLRSINLSAGGTFIPSFQNGGGTNIVSALRPSNNQPRAFQFQPDGTIGELDYGSRDLRPLVATAVGGSGSRLRTGQATPDIDQIGLSVVGHLDFTDKITGFTEAKFVRADTLSQTTPSFGQRTSAAVQAPALGTAAVLRLDNPFLGDQARSVIRSFLPANATTFSLNRNNEDLGLRGEDTTRDTFRLVAGIKGDLTDHLGYEVSLNYGQLDVEQDVLSNRTERNFALAVDAARAADGSIVCRSRLNAAGAIVTTGDAVIDNCVPVNLFGAGNVSAAARNYINADSTFDAKVKQQVATAFVTYDTGAFFELPGGPIGAAAGVEYRKESSKDGYSAEVRNGETFLNAIQPIDASYNVKEVFTELRLPVLKDLPGVEELTLAGSARLADYSLMNTDTIESWNGTLQWAPIRDVAFRVGVSKAVRAPQLGDLFQPETQNFANVSDPCDVRFINQGSATRAANCASLGLRPDFVNTTARAQTIEVRSSGNAGLVEEEGRSETLGVVLQPRWVPNLAITVDYYDIEIKSAIAAVSVQQILNSCVDAPTTTNIFCPLITRSANGEFARGGVLQQSLNFARLKARGIDAEVGYAYDWTGVGRFTTRFLGTYVRQRDNFTFPDAPNRPDQIREELGDPRRSFNLDLGYSRGPLSLSYQQRWIDSQAVVAIEAIRSVGGIPPTNPDIVDRPFTEIVRYHDVRTAYKMNDNLNVYFGIDNITDKKPPLGQTGLGAGSSIYSIEGQFFYGGLNWNFGLPK